MRRYMLIYILLLIAIGLTVSGEVLLKLGMICTIPAFWEYRVPILLTVLVVASVSSHMPSRFRYYSFVHGRVLE